MSSSISRFEIALSLRPITLINQVPRKCSPPTRDWTGLALAFFCLVFPWDGRGGEERADSDKEAPKIPDNLNSLIHTKQLRQ